MPKLAEEGEAMAGAMADAMAGGSPVKKGAGRKPSGAVSRFGESEGTMRQRMRRRASVQGTPLSVQQKLRECQQAEEEREEEQKLMTEKLGAGVGQATAVAAAQSPPTKEEEYARRVEQEAIAVEMEQERAMKQLIAMGVYGFDDTPKVNRREMRGYNPKPQQIGSGGRGTMNKGAVKRATRHIAKIDTPIIVPGRGSTKEGKNSASAKRMTKISTNSMRRKATLNTLAKMNGEIKEQREVKMYLLPNHEMTIADDTKRDNDRFAQSMSGLRRSSTAMEPDISLRL
jgi:hypothetical protein